MNKISETCNNEDLLRMWALSKKALEIMEIEIIKRKLTGSNIVMDEKRMSIAFVEEENRQGYIDIQFE